MKQAQNNNADLNMQDVSKPSKQASAASSQLVKY